MLSIKIVPSANFLFSGVPTTIFGGPVNNLIFLKDVYTSYGGVCNRTRHQSIEYQTVPWGPIGVQVVLKIVNKATAVQ